MLHSEHTLTILIGNISEGGQQWNLYPKVYGCRFTDFDLELALTQQLMIKLWYLKYWTQMQVFFPRNWRPWQNQAEGHSLLLCAEMAFSLQPEAVILMVFALAVCKQIFLILYPTAVVRTRCIMAQANC